MHRIVSSRASHFLSHLLRTQYAPSNRTSILLRRADALASARLPISNRSFFGNTALFSSRQMMDSMGESKQFR